MVGVIEGALHIGHRCVQVVELEIGDLGWSHLGRGRSLRWTLSKAFNSSMLIFEKVDSGWMQRNVVKAADGAKSEVSDRVAE